MDKPLIITLNETKIELISVINTAIQENRIPCYFIEPILSELLTQVREGAKNELQMAREQMKNAEQIENTEQDEE